MKSPAESFQFGLTKCSTHAIPQFLDEIRSLLADKSISPRTLLFLNAHLYNLASSDPILRGAIDRAKVVTADGMSIKWASPLFGTRIPERCNMTEAFRAFLASDDMPGARVAVWGASDDEVSQAATGIRETCSHCEVVDTASGFLSDDEYRARLAGLDDIDMVLIGMSSPRSEAMAEIAAEVKPEAVIWHIGAGTIRFLAGTVKEAPAIMRKTGLQWLHRLAIEPGRMWKRYLVGNTRFILLVLRHAILKK